MIVEFHFLLLAIGEILKVDNNVTAQSLQNFIANEDSFGGVRVPLNDCRLALELMESSGFIMNDGKAQYKRVTRK